MLSAGDLFVDVIATGERKIRVTVILMDGTYSTLSIEIPRKSFAQSIQRLANSLYANDRIIIDLVRQHFRSF